jgi:hypothetical protein
MRRREFLAGLGGALGWPLVARPPQRDRVQRIGVLMRRILFLCPGRAEGTPIIALEPHVNGLL